MSNIDENGQNCEITTIFIGNIAEQTQDSDVEQLFATFGSVKDLRVVRSSGKCFGFIEMIGKDSQDALNAISNLDGFMLNERAITVSLAQAKNEGGPSRHIQKFKTQECRYIKETGHCDFGDRCSYLHPGEPARAPKQQNQFRGPNNSYQQRNNNPYLQPSAHDMNMFDYGMFSAMNNNYGPGGAGGYPQAAGYSPAVAAGYSAAIGGSFGAPTTNVFSNVGSFGGDVGFGAPSNTMRGSKMGDNQQNTTNDRYKTKACRNFQEGSCAFGDRCHFIHQ